MTDSSSSGQRQAVLHSEIARRWREGESAILIAKALGITVDEVVAAAALQGLMEL